MITYNFVNKDEIVDSAVREAFKILKTDNITIKHEYFKNIQHELQAISTYFIVAQKVNIQKKANKLTNPYAPEYGFSSTEIAYQISKEKKDQAIVYNRLNKILSYLRAGQDIVYSLY